LPGSVTVGVETVGAGGGGGTLGVLTLGGFGALPVEGTLGTLGGLGGLGVLGVLGGLGVPTLGTVGVSGTDGTVGVTSEVGGTVGVETVGVCGSEAVGAVGFGTTTVEGFGFTLGAGSVVWLRGGFGFAVPLVAAPVPVDRAGAPCRAGADPLEEVVGAPVGSAPGAVAEGDDDGEGALARAAPPFALAFEPASWVRVAVAPDVAAAAGTDTRPAGVGPGADVGAVLCEGGWVVAPPPPAGAGFLLGGLTASWSLVESGVATTAIAPTTATAAAVAFTADAPAKSPFAQPAAGPRLSAPSSRRHGVSRLRSSSSLACLAVNSASISSNERPRQSCRTRTLSPATAPPSSRSRGAQNLSAVRSSQSSSGSGMPPFARAARARSNVAVTAHSAIEREPTRA
jgi:hypothetical protein